MTIWLNGKKEDKMEKVNWVQKLTSRKLWLAVVGFVTGLLLYFGMENEQVEKIATLIMSFASLLAYIIAEGLVDANRPGEIVALPEFIEFDDDPPEN